MCHGALFELFNYSAEIKMAVEILDGTWILPPCTRPSSIHSDYPPRDCTDTLKRPLSIGESLETHVQQCRCTWPYCSRPHCLHHHRPQHHYPQHHPLRRPASTTPSSVMPIIRCPIIGTVSRDRFLLRSLSRYSTLSQLVVAAIGGILIRPSRSWQSFPCAI